MSQLNLYPNASTIDAVNDKLVIWTNSLSAVQNINRNTFLNLASQPVGLTDSQTLTNKTLTSPTINGATLSGTFSGTYTIGGTPTFPSSVTQNTVSQTLTNKTLTSPTINSPTITNATISADTLTGYTVSNSGTIYGIPVTTGVINTAGTINGASLVANTVTSTQIADSNVGRTKINWSTFSNNIKSALNTSAPTLTNADQDLASCGLSLSFTCSGTAYAFVTVALSIGSTSDFEFRPEIRLGGAIQVSYTPPAATGNASSRTQVRTFSYNITLVNGVNTISAGVYLAAATSPFLQVGAGSISAIVFGNVTA